MRRTYSYREAVQILGGKDHPTVAALDKLLGGALLAGSLGLGQVLDLFDAKPDFTRLLSDLANKVSEKRRGLDRYSRTQRLHAAHAVIVITAFFEAFRELELPFSFTAEDDEHVVQYNPFEQDLPLPSAGLSYESNLSTIHDYYMSLTEDVLATAMALAAWDRLNETEAGRVQATLDQLPARAVDRYQELFRRLAVDFPEVAFWCSVEDHRATRAALARLEDVLRETTADQTPDRRQAELVGLYASALARPLIQSGELRTPALGEAYVDPRFQLMAVTGRETVPSTAEFWESRPERQALYAYLAGYLTSVESWRTPLLVLGDPGSGKSVLTEMLAARLSASGVPVVRVELRGVPAEADLREQIEHGLRRLLDEPLGWGEFSRDTGGSVPVVILDGLDELMQATGVSQTRYLTTIERFQEELLAKNRPAAFVVTSRLSVCAGLALPQQSHVVRLLSFSDDQVRQWLAVWNASDSPLPAEVALEYRELAQQPLLLLMLALYDAVDGALQRDHASISRGQLYERLLERFARREVTKSAVERTEDGVDEDVEFELDRLSVVALAMFNRGVQWVTGQQVTEDLAALLDVGTPDRAVGMRTPLSSGDLALGRFFFVQKSEAVRGDDTKLATYEFLHATFGEYLVARFVWKTFLELSREDAARSRRKSTVDDTELYSVLSFMALTTSKPVLDFLREFAGRSDRDGLFDLVVRLLERRDDGRLSRGDYRPVPSADSVRDARYAVNLVVLTLVLRHFVFAQDLRMDLDDWRRAALFWKSRLPSSEWDSIVTWFLVNRDEERHFFVELSDRTQQVDRDAHDERRLMSEPYVTLDDVGLTLWDVLTPMAAMYTVPVMAALIKLMATPIAECVPALVRLVESDPPPLVLAEETCARLGRGGDDHAILMTSGSYDMPYTSVTLDGWLRLHEQGFRFPDDRDYPGLREFLAMVPYEVFEGRQDLVRRATVAAAELGLEWQPPESWPERRGPVR
ncbi:NACHT domain-containing protein [Lentzea sp. NPDC004789]